jgi:hypothetical protein
MKVIYKYELTNKVTLPINSIVLKAGMQNGIMWIWVLVDNNELDASERNFEIIGTGHPFEYDYLNLRFVDTIFDGPFVWHVWEVNK